MIFDEKLIAKYNKPAPRYTSYPPANYFQSGMDSISYIEQIEASNNCEPKNISLYFHIPYCKKRCFYCGCNAYKMAKPDSIDRYVDAIIKELGMVCKHLDSDRKVSQVHFGGGTPNSLSIVQMERIMLAISKQLNYIANPEIAIECNPAYLDKEYIEGLARLGFNRFSLGIQDFNPKVLKAVNRDESKLPLEEIFSIIRSIVSMETINLDFIYGLPHQNAENFEQTIQKAINLRPDRLVTFSYAHMPSIFKAQQVFEKTGLPTANEKMQMFQNAFTAITNNGYSAIGFDHFALTNDELSIAQQNHELHRNFQGYCTRKTTGQVYAFGVSGITQLENAYVQNSKSINQYIEAISSNNFDIEKAHILTQEQKIVREVINELMCNLHIDFNLIAKRMNSELDTIRNTINIDDSALQSFKEDGILDYTDTTIDVKEQGLMFVRNIAAALDPLMKENTNAFSKTV